MSIRAEAQQLRAAVESLSGPKTQRRYGEQLRRRLGAHARERLSRGESLTAISSSVGVSVPTLARLAKSVSAFVPVAVVTTLSPPSIRVSRGLLLRGPCGLVVEGASVDEVAELFVRLASCSG